MAVASSSRPENAEGGAAAMDEVGAAAIRLGDALAGEIDELALQGFDVLLMDLYRVLVRLEPVEHLGEVLLVAAAHRFLLRELLAGVGKHRLFLVEFPLDGVFLLGAGGQAVRRRLARK